MRITIVGAGAMGSLMAARLTAGVTRPATSGVEQVNGDRQVDDVLLFGRPSPHLTAVQERGLQLTERNGTNRTVAIRASSNPADVEGSDVVVVLVKSWASAAAVAPLRSYLTRQTVVLTLQNGLGNAAMLRSALLNDGVRPHVWLGVTTQAAIRTEPGVVLHTGDGITAIGRRTSSVNPDLSALAGALTGSGWPTVAVEDIHRWVWRKLAVNAAINPLTALAGVPNAAISTDPALRTAAATLASEVATVAAARNVAIDRQEVIAAVDDVARATGDNRSSMLIDLEQGGRTEIDAINGAVIVEARRHGIAVPANQLMTALIRARERRADANGHASAAGTGTADDDDWGNA